MRPPFRSVGWRVATVRQRLIVGTMRRQPPEPYRSRHRLRAGFTGSPAVSRWKVAALLEYNAPCGATPTRSSPPGPNNPTRGYRVVGSLDGCFREWAVNVGLVPCVARHRVLAAQWERINGSDRWFESADPLPFRSFQARAGALAPSRPTPGRTVKDCLTVGCAGSRVV